MTVARSPLTGRRLGTLMLAYLVGTVAVIVLAPFRFQPFDPSRVVLGGGVADAVLNVVLFFPLGFLGERLGGGRVGVARVVALGLAASAAIEVSQLFIPGRYTTGTDLLANGLGAWAGARSSAVLRARIGSGSALVGRLFLDLPLIGLGWILLPLLWLVVLSNPGGTGWSRSLLPLAVAGGLLVAGAARSSTPSAERLAGSLLPVSLAWCAVGLAPALLWSPGIVAMAVAGHLAALFVSEPAWRALRRRQGRVEPVVVLVVLGLVGGYLLLGLGAGTSLERASGDGLRAGLLGWLESVAAFTALGYAITEWQGRTGIPWPMGALGPIVAALLLGVAVGGDSATTATLLIAIATVSAGLGALLYQLQLEHVVALREEGDGGLPRAHDPPTSDVPLPISPL